MGQFKFTQTKIEGVLGIEPRAFEDDRGWFMENYNLKSFIESGFTHPMVQDNMSKSKKGVLRGLHYQNNPSPMGKLVSCVHGQIFDVGVDIRKGSPTFGQWYGEILSNENKKMLYFPPGIAHGFLALKDDTVVYYKCTGLYSAKDDSAVVWNDPDIGIDWPIKEVGGNVILSDRDQAHPRLKDANNNHVFKKN